MEWDFDFFDTVGEYASDAFEWLTKDVPEWMNKNPEAAKILGGVGLGVASGAANYLEAERQREHEERMYDRRKKDSMIKPSSGIGDYGGHIGQLSGGTGLLTNGYLTKK